MTRIETYAVRGVLCGEAVDISVFNPLAVEQDIEILAQHLCKM